MSDENITVTENATVVRDPVTGQSHHVTERVVERTDNSNWGLWVAGLAVFGAVLVIALFLIFRNNTAATTTDDQVLAAQAETDAARLQADQAIQDANNARLAAATAATSTTVLSAGNQAANDAAARSAAAAEAAADRASAAADAARVAPPPPVEPVTGDAEKIPSGQ